jgi:hypothetical protein
MQGTQWARLRTEAEVPLRRGVWYRVLKLTPTHAVLDVHQRQISIAKGVLQIAPRPATSWAVVPRPAGARGMPQSWGPRYAVCPNCHARAPLPRGPASMRCQSCGGVFDIGWGDTYFG